MKKGTYIASTEMDGSVMFRIDGEAFTIRKGKDLEVQVKSERAKVTFPASFMTLTLKNGTETVVTAEPKSESKPEVAKKEIETVAETKVEVKEEPEVEVVEEKPTRASTKAKSKRTEK